jgi:LacI family transcriptional regulator
VNINRDRVAELAGVSPVTVSRVFRNSTLVDTRTRQRVLEASQQCGYRPNSAARAIRQGRFNRVAAVVVQYGDPGTAYVPTTGFMDPAVNALAEHGYSMVTEPLYLDIRNDDFHQPPRLFAELAVDGILGLPASGIVPPRVDEYLSQLGSPIVWMNREPQDGIHCVSGDEFGNGRKLAQHLIDLGHRRIGYIGFESPNYQLRDRVAGVRAALTEAGLDTGGILIGPRGCCLVDLAEQILDCGYDVSAVICFHRGGYDAMTHTAMRRGIRVPQQLSICYFSSTWQVVLSDYRPTSVDLAESQIGTIAVHRLVQLIKGETLSPVDRVSGILVPGWTTAAPGQAWAEGVERCRHEAGQCLYSYRTAKWIQKESQGE